MSTRKFSVSVPAEACYLKAIRSFFKPILADWFGEQAELVILAIDESCSNLLKHQCGGVGLEAVSVQAEAREDRCLFRIDNFCNSGDVPNIKPRSLGEVRPGGLGTHFVNQIMDKVWFEPAPGTADRMCLILEKSIKK